MNLIKALAVILPAGAVASFAIPTFLDAQKRKELTKKFRPALKHYNRINISPGGKEGRLAWPSTVASLDPSTLPTIPGGVFIMMRGERIVTGTNWEDRPPKIHDSFFELDDALRAKSLSDIRTLVYVKPHFVTTEYSSGGRSSANRRILNQKVVHLHIFDLQKNVAVGSWKLFGQKPPHSFRGDRMPDPEPPPSIAEFLKALPRL